MSRRSRWRGQRRADRPNRASSPLHERIQAYERARAIAASEAKVVDINRVPTTGSPQADDSGGMQLQSGWMISAHVQTQPEK